MTGPLQPRERISAAINAAAADGGVALVPFITAGYPVRDAFIETLRAVASAGDVVEVGVPFSDPMADGMTIQRSSQAAIASGVTLRWILEQLTAAGDIGAPIVLMSYLNPLLAYDYDRLAADARAAGVCGFIVPDLPLDESAPLRAALEPAGLALIQLVTPATPDERMRRLCAVSTGFVYAVTVKGTTGGAGAAVSADMTGYLDRVRAAAKIPVCAGFGVRESAQVRALAGHTDGVIVGSALVETLEAGADPAAFLRSLRG